MLVIIPRVSLAGSIESYLRDLQSASSEFKAFSDDSVDFRDEKIVTAAESVLKQTIERFPLMDEVDYRDQKIPVDNSWIRDQAAAFSRETNPARKKQIVVSIGERMDAIMAEVGRLEYVTPRDTSKDEEKRKLAGILNQEEYKPAEDKTESPAARLYQSIERWLASLFPTLKQPDPNKRADLSGLKTVLQIVIFLVVGALLVFLIVRFGPQLLKGYRKTSKGSRETKLILGEEIGPDRTTANLFEEAENLANTGDIRGAIRKGYISLLFELSERRMIGLAKHKTNRDYLRDLTKHEQVRSNVGGLTLNYERHWYGRKVAEANDWSEFRKGYHETLSR